MNGFIDEVWCSKCNNVYVYQLINGNNTKEEKTNEINCPKCKCVLKTIEPAAVIKIIKCRGQLETIEESDKDE